MTQQDDKEEPTKFKVEDRRRFTESGARDGDVDEEPAAPTTTAAPPGNAGVMRDESASQPPMELNFSTFIISLSTQALALLGEIPDPLSQETHVDLGAARQMIDIVGILQEKTHGNLDKAESELIQGLLYDLRLRFVERARR